MLKDIKIGTLVKVICLGDGFEETGPIKRIISLHGDMVYYYTIFDERGRKGSACFCKKDIDAGITKIEIIG